MKIKTHSKPLTTLADLMNTDRDDCAAWIEEYLLEECSGEDLLFFSGNTLTDELTEEQLSNLTYFVMGHFNRESTIFYPGIKKLISELQIFKN